MSQSQSSRIENMLREADNLQYQQLNKSGALAYCLKAWEECNRVKDHPLRLQIGNRIGDLYASEKLHEQSLAYYRKLTRETKTSSEWRFADLYTKIAIAHGSVGTVDSSSWYFDQVVDYYDISGESESKISTLTQYVNVLNENQEYERAIRINEQLRSVLELNNKSPGDLAIIDNNIGFCYNNLQNYKEAVSYFEKARPLLAKGTDKQSLDINLGIAYFNLGELDKSVLALQGVKKNKNATLVRTGEVDQILSNVYLQKGDFQNALAHQQYAESLAHEEGELTILRDAYFTGAQVHTNLYEYETALDYYQKYFKLSDSISLEERLLQQQLLQQQQLIEGTERDVKLLLVNQELQELTIEALEAEKVKQKLKLDNLKLDSAQRRGELDLLKTQNVVQEEQVKNQKLEVLRSQQELRIFKQNLTQVQSEKDLADLRQIEEAQKLVIQQRDAKLREEQLRRNSLEKDKAINELELAQQIAFKRNLGIGLLLLVGLLLTLFLLYRNQKKDHAKLTSAYSSLELAQGDLEKAQNRIKNLLDQQVSGAVADALLASGDDQKVEKRFVCIMFLDIRDYTGFAEGRDPEEIISYQNAVFGTMIETVVEKGGIVNQILGDGFMATFGAPVSAGNDCLQAYTAARTIMKDVKRRSERKEIPYTNIGIGLHAGHVVTGNVGTKSRKQYSITGNTVILAARLEQLNKQFNSNLVISKDVYDQLPVESRETVSFENVMVKGRSTPIAVASFTSQ